MHSNRISFYLACALSLVLTRDVLADYIVTASGMRPNTAYTIGIPNVFHNRGSYPGCTENTNEPFTENFSFTTDARGQYNGANVTECGNGTSHCWETSGGSTTLTINGVFITASVTAGNLHGTDCWSSRSVTITGNSCQNGSSVIVHVTSTNRSGFPYYHDRGYSPASYYFDVQFWKSGESYYRIRLTTPSWLADGVAHTNTVQAPPGALPAGSYTVHINCSLDDLDYGGTQTVTIDDQCIQRSLSFDAEPFPNPPSGTPTPTATPGATPTPTLTPTPPPTPHPTLPPTSTPPPTTTATPTNHTVTEPGGGTGVASDVFLANPQDIYTPITEALGNNGTVQDQGGGPGGGGDANIQNANLDDEGHTGDIMGTLSNMANTGNSMRNDMNLTKAAMITGANSIKSITLGDCSDFTVSVPAGWHNLWAGYTWHLDLSPFNTAISIFRGFCIFGIVVTFFHLTVRAIAMQ